MSKRHTIKLEDFTGFEIRQVIAASSREKKSLHFLYKNGRIKYVLYQENVIILETDMIAEAIEKYNEL